MVRFCAENAFYGARIKSCAIFPANSQDIDHLPTLGAISPASSHEIDHRANPGATRSPETRENDHRANQRRHHKNLLKYHKKHTLEMLQNHQKKSKIIDNFSSALNHCWRSARAGKRPERQPGKRPESSPKGSPKGSPER